MTLTICSSFAKSGRQVQELLRLIPQSDEGDIQLILDIKAQVLLLSIQYFIHYVTY